MRWTQLTLIAFVLLVNVYLMMVTQITFTDTTTSTNTETITSQPQIQSIQKQRTSIQINQLPRWDSLGRTIINSSSFLSGLYNNDEFKVIGSERRLEANQIEFGPKFWKQHEFLAEDRRSGKFSYIPMDRNMYEQSFEQLTSLEPVKDYAFASFFKFNYHTPDYLKGLLALIMSFKAIDSRFPFVVYTVEEFPDCVHQALLRLGVKEIVVTEPLIPNNNSFDSAWRTSFDKLVAWSMLQYKKMVLLDSDIIFAQNADELMSFPDISGTLDYCYGCITGENLNAGVVVMEPNSDNYDKIRQYATTEKSCISNTFKWFDQELLICLYSKRRLDLKHHIGDMVQLPYVYNAKPHLCNCRGKRNNGKWVQWVKEEVKIVHFVCVDKPWEVTKVESWKDKKSFKCEDEYYIQWDQHYKKALQELNINKLFDLFDDGTKKLILERKSQFHEKMKKEQEARKAKQPKPFDQMSNEEKVEWKNARMVAKPDGLSAIEKQVDQKIRLEELREKMQKERDERKHLMLEKLKQAKQERIEREKKRQQDLKKQRQQLQQKRQLK
jgi:lipopolysaccharide biosynthesis glycosyltransferase